MITKLTTLYLPEGIYQNVPVTVFDSSDINVLREVYTQWRSLSLNLIALGGRGVNLPEGLSEALFCISNNVVRFNHNLQGANTSFDCYSELTNARIQVKACSVLPDLTSFGPKSVYDELFFMDFFREGKFDGSVDIYKIPKHIVDETIVNASLGETVQMQREQGRRPRLSLYNLAKVHNILPITIKFW